MTVAPPLLRLHLVPALLSAALICVLLAYPAAGKQPGKEPPGQAKKAAKAKVAPGQAKKAAKATPPGQAKKAATAQAAPKAAKVPPGQAKKAARTTGNGNGAAGGTPPGQAKKAATAQAAPKAAKVPPGQAKKAAQPTGNGNGAARGTPPGQAKKAAGVKRAVAPARTRRAARARAARARSAARRRAAAARRRTIARRRAAAAGLAAARAAVAPTTATGATGATGATSAGGSAGGAPDTSGERNRQKRSGERERGVTTTPPTDKLPRPFRVVRDIVHVVPTPLRILVAGLVALACLLAGAALLTLLRNRRLARQQRELLGRVGLLQAALLPEVPPVVGALAASVAYRPAEGPAAGGDFYDVLSLAGGRTAIVIGDVSGHGREALARTALARYTLRAYVEAGMEPGESLQIAGSVLAGKLEGDFITALIAVHDAGAGTLTYASAGHPPPIVVSSAATFKPILTGGAPPLGVGAATGQRQTTLAFPRGSVACFYTDGLSEARMASGRLVGAPGLERIVRTLGPDANADQVIAGVTAISRKIGDDAATVVIGAEEGSAIVRSRVERIELSRAELRGPLMRRFLDACGVSPHAVRAAEGTAREIAREAGGAIVEVRIGDDRSDVEVHRPALPQREDVALSGYDLV